MRPCLLPAALILALVAAACSSAPPRPSGAGSTAVLRLMRDWRGVWTGQIRDSPMGAMPYTLYVAARGDHLSLTSAQMREAGLESLRHEYRLFHFDQGLPLLQYRLAQRSRIDEGTLVYLANLSNDDEAVFCAEDRGCDELKLTVVRLSETSVEFRTMIDESNHSAFALSFNSRDIPQEHESRGSRSAPSGDRVEEQAKPRVQLDEDGNPLDQDLTLPENLDQDLGVKKKEAEPKKAPARPDSKR
ncbi:MAG: hypothetical protein HY901_27570 [Deltaproteobacteria bacterium]|nr:hypothetical protein [Deltaproteobacteria bacterium]